MNTQPGFALHTGKSVDDAAAAIEQAAANNGFRVLYVHDVQQTLKEKGFEIPAYRIVEVCNAKFAHHILTKDPSVGMMLPCRIAVYREKEETTLLLMKPSLIGELMPEADLGSVPQDVENILVKVMQESV